MHLRQSFARWCYASTPIDELCALAARIGFEGIDLVDPADWPLLDEHGLVCSLANSHPISRGLNDPAHHGECERLLRDAIERSARHGCPSVVCFSGNRGAVDDERGIDNAADLLTRLAPLARSAGVTLCLELLNSKDHEGYMCDRTAWGVEVCRRVDSRHVKLLYDVYHMQRMEGDLVATLESIAGHVGHIHTAGVPGRHELDDRQEVHYPAVFRALVRSGYTGWVGHEFLPTRDAETGLREAFDLVRSGSHS